MSACYGLLKLFIAVSCPRSAGRREKEAVDEGTGIESVHKELVRSVVDRENSHRRHKGVLRTFHCIANDHIENPGPRNLQMLYHHLVAVNCRWKGHMNGGARVGRVRRELDCFAVDAERTVAHREAFGSG
ncbi:hypothetical protein PM082_003577 [Marasmius tenuissimus]|nr:hypothetical protein PM082_003577 [Marasmius tenuissimus]